jgi:hypothetical protein
MGEANDFTLAPAHAHLNLLGWVTMALYGTFYALARDSLPVKLAWSNFVVSTLGVLVMIPALGLYLAGGNDPRYIPGMVVGEVLTVLGMLLFAVAVARELMRSRVSA